MAIPAGKTWQQHLNEQINRLVKFRDNVEALEEFEQKPFEQMDNAMQAKVTSRAAAGVSAVKAGLDDIVAYLQGL